MELLAEINVLLKNLMTQTVHQLQVKVDIPTIKMEVKSEVQEELILNSSQQGGSFWETLLGGLGGGVLGALGKCNRERYKFPGQNTRSHNWRHGQCG